MKLALVSGATAAVALTVVGAIVLFNGQAGPEAVSAADIPGIQATAATTVPPATSGSSPTTPPSTSPPSSPSSIPSSIPPSKPPAGTTKTTTKPPVPIAAPNSSGPITFYAAKDNDPPGSRSIAFPGTLHDEAGGSGTFADPLTFAAVEGLFEPGTKVYVPDVQRYFILEDTCATCSGSQIDLWTGPADDNGVISCEEALTRDSSRPYEVNPPAGLPVVAGDLYHSGKCYQS
jgi:3D (Asp-Asp-Asp) domain-containing protein